MHTIFSYNFLLCWLVAPNSTGSLEVPNTFSSGDATRALMLSHESTIVNKNRWLVISTLLTHGVAYSLIHKGKTEDFPSYCNIRKTKSQDILLTHMKWQGEQMHEPPPLSTCLITPDKPTGNCHNLSSRYHTPDFPCSHPIMQKR